LKKDTTMAVKDEVRKKLAGYLGRPVDKVAYEAALTDLVSDSFRLVEIAIELQEDFEVRLVQDDLKAIRTVGDLAELIATRAA
jgi:acyl carrier protein